MAEPTTTRPTVGLPSTGAPPRSYDRRLRGALVALAMVCAVLVLAFVGVLFYWQHYLLRPAPGVFSRGPFLTRLTETGAELRWRTAHPEAVELLARAGGVTHLAHDGRFSDLSPATAYAWTAAVGGTVRSAGSFTTAPRTRNTPIRFAVIGDYGSGNEHEWAVGRVVAAARPAFLLTTGDNSYLAAVPPLLDRNIFRPLHDVMAGAPTFATLGEHDVAYRNGAVTIEALGLPGDGHRYAVRYGPLQIVVLGVHADAAAVRFARSALAEPGPSLRFVVVHRPLQVGDPLLPILRARNVAAVLAGHLHRYERRVVGGVRQYVVGTSGQGPGGSEFTRPSPDAAKSLLDFGALLVAVAPGRIDYSFVDERGRVLDTDHDRR